MSAPELVLVGPPGAGKTTVGQLVADRLGLALRDTDADVEAAAGCSVAELFLTEGEAGFRAREERAVAAALAEHPGVVALGGGAVHSASTRALLAGHRVAFLDAGLAEVTRRTGLARDRPVLAMNPRAQLRALLDERRPWYLAVSQVRFDTAARTAGEVAQEVLAWLAKQG